MAMLRMLPHPAFLFQLRIHPLDVRCGNRRQLFSAQYGLDVLFRIHTVSAHGAVAQPNRRVFIQPAVKPLTQCHLAVFAQLHAAERLDILMYSKRNKQ